MPVRLVAGIVVPAGTILCYYRDMRQFEARVAEVAALAGLVQVSCAGPDPGTAPGQACLVWAARPEQPAWRLALFPGAIAGGLRFYVPPTHPYARLEPGDRLEVLGPCGRGFRLPRSGGHLLVVAASLERLLPTIDHALDHGLAVSVLTPRSAALLPSDVEIQRGPLASEVAAWADLIILDVGDPAARAQHIRTLVPARARGFIQALVAPPMPCGTGACQACWVEGAHASGRLLACVDGPVVNL